MAVGFDLLLAELLRNREIGEVVDERIMRGHDRTGIRLRIEAEILTPAQADEAEAGMRSAYR